jgi:DNA replication protein DnaC
MVSGRASQCACTIERKVRAVLPERYWPAKLEDFSGPASELVLDWLLNPTDGLFIAGPCGTGKTHLGSAIVRHFITKGVGIKLVRCADFYRDVRQMFKSESQGEESAVMSPLEKARYLILDDLGAGSLSDCERRYTLELLDVRLNRMRPTIVTSNWSLQEISERMDDRIASRLAGFAALELAGKDKRVPL